MNANHITRPKIVTKKLCKSDASQHSHEPSKIKGLRGAVLAFGTPRSQVQILSHRWV